jgi:hypothetical protein
VLREALRKPEGKEHVYYVPIRSMIETPSYISFFTSGRNPERVCGLMIILFLKEQIKDIIIIIENLGLMMMMPFNCSFRNKNEWFAVGLGFVLGLRVWFRI